MARRVAAVTSTRADFGLLRWILAGIAAAPELELQLVVTGTHLAPEFGLTVGEVEASGLAIAARVPILEGDAADDTGLGTARTMGRAVSGLGDAFAALRPDLVLLLGDRFEVAGAGAAATALRLPIAHLCGGETTEGAVDQVWRNTLTKMAHLHLVATPEYGRRVVAMGEAECRVRVVGSPGLESFRHLGPARLPELAAELGLALEPPLLLLTFHPVTNPPPGEPPTPDQLEAVLAALATAPGTVIATMANADAGGRAVNARLARFAAERPRTHLVASLGADRYLRLMQVAAAMVGNSSSGLIEAPSAGLPAVNVGSRQRGRLRGANVVEAEPEAAAVSAALARALDPEFRRRLAGAGNPYGDGLTAERVVRALVDLDLGPELLRKL